MNEVSKKQKPLLDEVQVYLQSFLLNKTVIRYLYDIRLFLHTEPNARYFGYKDIVRYIIEFKKDYKSKNGREYLSLPSKLKAIRHFYTFLYYHGYRNDHPCIHLKIKSNSVSGTQFSELLTPSELQQLLKRVNAAFSSRKSLLVRNKGIMSLMIFQGLTRLEICNLKVADINFKTSTVLITSTPSCNERKLFLSSAQKKLIRTYISQVRNKLLKERVSDLLFVSMSGEKLRVGFLLLLVGKLRPKNPKKSITPLSIRRSVIANWLNVHNYSIDEVQIMAGHKYPQTTLSYIRTDTPLAKATIEKYHPLTW